jgi:uncharacterized protein YjbJ (UPF0337 family)
LGKSGSNQSRFRQRNLFAMTTKLQFKGSWNEVKGKFKQKYAQLADDDLSFAEGKQNELLGRLQQKLGKSKEDLRAERSRSYKALREPRRSEDGTRRSGD